MPIAELIAGSLFQADGDPAIFDKLTDRGISRAMVIDLCGVDGLTVRDAGRSVYIRWPIEDGDVPDLGVLTALEIAATRFVDSGGCVVTMCSMGRNRSGLLSALILTRVRGMSGREAGQFVRSKVPEALTNEAFASYLERER